MFERSKAATEIVRKTHGEEILMSDRNSLRGDFFLTAVNFEGSKNS